MSQDRTGTRYFEKYACLSLAYIDEEIGAHRFIYGGEVESPDLQNERDSIGIEVTRAISPSEGRAHRTILNYLAGEGKEADTVFHHAYPRVASRVDFGDDMAFIYAVQNVYDFKIHLQNLQKAIEVKTGKLNDIYRKFDSNRLYIFTFNLELEERDINLAAREARKRTAHLPAQYDALYINCVNTIYSVNGRGEVCARTLLSEAELSILKTDALLP